jgi:MFS family permease
MFFTLKRITMFIVSMALFMDVLDTNVINTAVPAMAHTFSVSPIDIKIALISYLLSLAIFIPISGWTADKYGTKYIFIAAMGVFKLSSFF